MIVVSTLLFVNAVVLEAALSFLGAGVNPPEPSLGVLIAAGLNDAVLSPHLLLAPSIALIAIVLSLGGFAEGLRRALDPRGALNSRPGPGAMIGYALRRLASALVTAWVASMVAFVLFWTVPNVDPAYWLGGAEKGNEATRARATEEYGLDDPLPVQYVRLMESILNGEVGCLLQLREPARPCSSKRSRSRSRWSSGRG